MNHPKRWRDLHSSIPFIIGNFGKATFVMFMLGVFLGVGMTLAGFALLAEHLIEEMR